ncbi:MAG TPA: hypothetical protein DEB24_08015 [Coriobacteriia bacterium]|nr:hypothetical protein [Coriobacteriia bacterium]
MGVIMALLSLSVALSAASAFKGSAKTMTFIAAFDFSWVIVILLSVGLYCFSEVIESLDKVSKKEHQE